MYADSEKDRKMHYVLDIEILENIEKSLFISTIFFILPINFDLTSVTVIFFLDPHFFLFLSQNVNAYEP